jgi:hypothetical protein
MYMVHPVGALWLRFPAQPQTRIHVRCLLRQMS